MYRDLAFDPYDDSLDESELGDYDFDDYSLSDPDFRDLDFDDYSLDEPDVFLDVPFVPTDEKVVQAMLDLAEVTSKDLLYDLGCGDGRIVVAAALDRNARGIGIDMDPMRVAEAMEYAGNTGVEFMVDFFEDDLLEADFSQATVVTLYLLDLVNVELRPRLLNELRPGTRIVSHAFDMADWRPDERKSFSGINLFKWIVPAQVAGAWQWQASDGDTYKVELEQKFQRIKGKAWVNGKKAQLNNALLSGDLLELLVQKDAENSPISFIMRCEENQLVAADGDFQATPAVKIKDTI
ncbi:class I SAM-dependent methyltransferase [Marinospirillum insulare]|uniref:Methyltransferase n=1 Tax=Marinospirillum insulare TaxID=217169 RepID=A0ABQ5ZWX3_9GAMM|nr:class I SAM-dependent methyltransferase [Marinospirillum insulare]GLR63833.1 methyltransferase [Marinospirillum insulare]